MRSLKAIVRAYRRLYKEHNDEELGSFRRERTVRGAIERAAVARTPGGKRYDHQRRLSAGVLQQVQRRLKGVSIASARSFEELHDLVEGRIGSFLGVGELMVYDTALRIGARLGLLPSRVYLHSGTREGAKALGLDWRAAHLDVSSIPQELRTLEPHYIEDCLCIFKRDLARLSARALANLR